MNYYGFAHPLRAFLGRKDLVLESVEIQADELAAWLAEARGKMPWQNALSQLNLLDSHDTPRFLTMVDGDVQLMKLGVVMLMCYVGTPCVYYGDEVRVNPPPDFRLGHVRLMQVGLEGGNDPDCRRCFPWHDQPSWNLELLQHYQALIRLRRESACLQSGSIVDLYAQGDVYCFARFDSDTVWIVAINRGEGVDSLPLADINLLSATKLSVQALLSSSEVSQLVWDEERAGLLLTLESKGFLVATMAVTD